MDDNHVDLPNRLYNMLAWTIGGGDCSDDILWQEGKVKLMPKLHRKILSFGQDMVMASSHGRVVMPKHVCIAKYLQQKTGSHDAIGMLNQFGHSINKSFLQEMDTAHADALIKKDLA